MHIQHNSIPTRLIDWTRDVLVALFFACFDKFEKHKKEHGVIYTLIINNKVIESHDLFYNKVNLKYKKHNLSIIAEYLQNKLNSFNKILLLEPLIKTPRMRSQNGVFCFFPLVESNKNKGYPMSFNEVLSLHSMSLLKKTIHRNYKEEILDELNNYYGISEKSLFINNDMIIKEQEKLFSCYANNLKYVNLMLNRSNCKND